MTKISVCSLFRDSNVWHNIKINQVESYFLNLRKQAKLNNIIFKFHCLEGDSRDNTLQTLEQYQKYYDVSIIKYDIGGSAPSSAGSNERRKLLSDVGNKCLHSALKDETDLILWMESDLIPVNNMLGQLLKSIEKIDWNNSGLIAPTAIINLQGQNCFYDGWAYEGISKEKWTVQDLGKFTSQPELIEMNAIGCASLINANNLRKYNIDFQDGCFPRMCELIRENNLKLFCQTNCFIQHPSSNGCIADRWI